MRKTFALLVLFLFSCHEDNKATSGHNCVTLTSTATASSHRQVIAQSLMLDIDGDGVINAYDSAPFDSNRTVIGNGTEENPFIIYNDYQLAAFNGYDHTGSILSESNYTNKSYLYSASVSDRSADYYFYSGNNSVDHIE